MVGAFDVVEHCDPEHVALAELARVLAPGGRLLVSVPAYQWAWSDFDDQNGHHRRYTRERATRAVEAAGLEVQRATYAFSSVFPFFAAERLAAPRQGTGTSTGWPHRARGRGQPAAGVSRSIDRMLTGLTRLDNRLLAKRDLPFGSSVVVAASKPLVSS